MKTLYGVDSAAVISARIMQPDVHHTDLPLKKRRRYSEDLPHGVLQNASCCPNPRPGVNCLHSRHTPPLTSPDIHGLTSSGPQWVTSSCPQMMTSSGLQRMTSPGLSGVTSSGPRGITSSGPQGVMSSGPHVITTLGPHVITSSGSNGMTSSGLHGITLPSSPGMTSPGTGSYGMTSSDTGSYRVTSQGTGPQRMTSPSPQSDDQSEEPLDLSQHPPNQPRDSQDCRLLWEFLSGLLTDTQYEGYVLWEDRANWIFRIVNPHGLAQLWGLQKRKDNMNYEKLSRALRYYYKMNIIAKVPKRRLTYRFMTPPQHIIKGVRGAKPGVPHVRRRGAGTRNPSNTAATGGTSKQQKKNVREHGIQIARDQRVVLARPASGVPGTSAIQRSRSHITLHAPHHCTSGSPPARRVTSQIQDGVCDFQTPDRSIKLPVFETVVEYNEWGTDLDKNSSGMLSTHEEVDVPGRYSPARGSWGIGREDGNTMGNPRFYRVKN